MRSVQFIFCLLIVLFITTADAKVSGNHGNNFLFGILVPTLPESYYLKKTITNQKVLTISGTRYITGKIANKKVVFVLSGLGEVNTAVFTSRMIDDFHPDLILLSGTAGNINPTVKKHTVVIGKRIVDADLGILTASGPKFSYQKDLMSPQVNKEIPLEFYLDSSLLNFTKALAKRINHPKIIFGTIATSNALPNPLGQINLLQKDGVDAVEMEGSAFMQTCWLFNTKCIVIRAVSNDARQKFTDKDLTQAANYAAKTTINIITDYPIQEKIITE